MDEKGFLIGVSCTKKRVVSIEGLKSKRIIGASQDGNREFITLIVLRIGCVSVAIRRFGYFSCTGDTGVQLDREQLNKME